MCWVTKDSHARHFKGRQRGWCGPCGRNETVCTASAFSVVFCHRAPRSLGDFEHIPVSMSKPAAQALPFEEQRAMLLSEITKVWCWSSTSAVF